MSEFTSVTMSFLLRKKTERQALRVQFFAIFHLFLGLDFTKNYTCQMT